MIVIHCGYGSQFFLWGECSFNAKRFRGRRRASIDGVPDHPFDPGAGRIAEALSGMGFEYHDLSRKEKLKMKLPTLAGKYPIPSTPILGELPKAKAAGVPERAAAALREWAVEALPLGAEELLGLRGILTGREPLSHDGRFLAPGVIASLDLCYVMECLSYAVSLLARGRFIPGIKLRADGMKYESIWNPLFIGDDAAKPARVEALAPDVIRAREGAAGFEKFSLREMLSEMMDGIIRLAWSKRGARDRDASQMIAKAIMKNALAAESCRSEKKKRGRLVNALNPHELWIRSLGWMGETDGLSQSLGSIYPQVRDWRESYEWFEHAPYRMVVRLRKDAGKNGDGPDWGLEYELGIPWAEETVPARAVWSGAGEAAGEAGNYMRRYLILMLGRIAAISGPVRRCLDDPAPEGCRMSLDETEVFLRDCAPALPGIGAEIEYPDWWITEARDLLSIKGTRGDRDGAFRWKLAWRGRILSAGELRALLNRSGSLAQLRGEWVYLPREHVEEISRHMDGLPEFMPTVEAVRLAVRDPLVEGFDGMPELESIYDALRGGNPPEILDGPADMRGELRPYQRHGYSWLAFLSGLGIGVCLADDMGLGKTLQTLSLVRRYREQGQKRPVLLICPTSVIENWRREMTKFFPSMTYYVHHGQERLRGERFAREASQSVMVLSSYALLHRDAESFKSADWLGVVLDEAQNIKNPDTRQTKAARGIRSDWRLALTGTPIENHVGDLWSIMEFLMPGMLGSRKHFADTYVKPLASGPDERLAGSLRRMISPLILRRLKTDPDIAPDLPAKIQTNECCHLKKEQLKLYASVAGDLSREIGRVAGIKRKGMILAGLTKMKQVCDHPSLVLRDGNHDAGRSSKMERLVSLAEEMFEAGDRALIFTQYVEMGSILKHELQERFGREAPFLHGGVPKARRDVMVRDFAMGTGPQFFVLSLRAGGVGLNLANANHVVMFDRWWNPAVETQAIDRAHRLGQKRNVHVHIFSCRGTLEERIDELIASKRRMADSVIWKSGDWVTELSDRDLRYLISLSQVEPE